MKEHVLAGHTSVCFNKQTSNRELSPQLLYPRLTSTPLLFSLNLVKTNWSGKDCLQLSYDPNSVWIQSDLISILSNPPIPNFISAALERLPLGALGARLVQHIRQTRILPSRMGNCLGLLGLSRSVLATLTRFLPATEMYWQRYSCLEKVGVGSMAFDPSTEISRVLLAHGGQVERQVP